MILNIFGTGAVILLVLAASASDWPNQRESWARVVGAAIILAAIWL